MKFFLFLFLFLSFLPHFYFFFFVCLFLLLFILFVSSSSFYFVGLFMLFLLSFRMSVEELLRRITQKEMSHLTLEKSKLEQTLCDLGFRHRKLQKKLLLCTDSMVALKHDFDHIEKKLSSLKASLATWEEENACQNSVLIDLLCEKNPLPKPEEEDKDLLEMGSGIVRGGSLHDLIQFYLIQNSANPPFAPPFCLLINLSPILFFFSLDSFLNFLSLENKSWL